MGDVGDYWREHKEHQARVARRKAGITAADERRCERERILKRKAEWIAKCTVKCECGKWLLDAKAHTSHKSQTGKKGHSVVETKEAEKPKETDWSDII